jgi:hypothetical protein
MVVVTGVTTTARQCSRARPLTKVVPGRLIATAPDPIGWSRGQPSTASLEGTCVLVVVPGGCSGDAAARRRELERHGVEFDERPGRFDVDSPRSIPTLRVGEPARSEGGGKPTMNAVLPPGLPFQSSRRTANGERTFVRDSQ